MTRILLVLMLAVSFANAQNPPTTLPQDLTLRQALEIALVNSTVLRQARASLEQATGQYLQARSNLLPQLDIGAHQGFLTVNLQGIGIDLLGFPRVLGPS